MNKTQYDEESDTRPAPRDADQPCRYDLLSEALSGGVVTDQHVEHLLDHLDRIPS